MARAGSRPRRVRPDPGVIPVFASRPAAPGTLSGFAVVTDRFVGLLGSDSDAGVAVELYRLLEEPSTTITDVLDVFAAFGANRRFALVEVRDAATRVVHVAVRGDIAVDMTGVDSTRLSGERGATWFNGEVRGVETLALRVGVPDPADGPALPIRRGVVPAAEVRFDEDHGARSALQPPADVQLRTVPIELPALAPAAEAAPPAAEDPAPGASPVAAPHASRVDLASIMQAPVWRLTLPDGSTVDPGTPVVLGRRPWRTSPEETTTAYVVTPSPHREISGVHLEIALRGSELYARDLGSTNGTIIATPGRAPRLLRDGRSAVLVDGDVLDLGEDFRVLVATGG